MYYTYYYLLNIIPYFVLSNPGVDGRYGTMSHCEKAKVANLPGKRRKNSMSEAKRIAKAQVAGGTAPLIPHACPSHRHQRHRTGAHLPVVAGQA